MSQGRGTYTVIVSAAIFILMEVAALAMLSSSSTLQDIWLNRISHRTAAALWSGGEKVRSHFYTYRQNDELAEENARLREELRALRGSDPAAAVLPAAPSGGFIYTPATIVKLSRGTAHNYIILNRGSEDGIIPQSGIITEKGIVGVISAVDRHYAYGLTLMNSNVSVSVRLGEDGVAAPMRWDGVSSDGAVVSDIPPHYQINPGDTVRTSGLSAIFPGDIPVGIAGESRLVDGSTRQVKVRLFQDFNSLRYVTVTESAERSEIEALEASESRKR